MLPASIERMSKFTSKELSQAIQDQTVVNIARYGASNPDALSHRLYMLDHELDLDRAFQVRSSIVTLAGIGLGLLWSPYWLVISAAAMGFMLLYGMVGWCPPVNILRRMGYRTPAEIDYERYALKAIRGDFKRLPEIGEQKELGRIEELLETIKH